MTICYVIGVTICYVIGVSYLYFVFLFLRLLPYHARSRFEIIASLVVNRMLT